MQVIQYSRYYVHNSIDFNVNPVQYDDMCDINTLLHWCFAIRSDIARPVGSAMSSRIAKHQCNNVLISHISSYCTGFTLKSIEL